MNTMYPFNPLTGYNPYATVTNPVIPNYQPIPQPGPHMEVQRVNGKESALAFSIGPNSSVILVDNLEPKIWFVTTDASGYKAVNGFKIIPDEEPEPVKVSVEDQMTAINERLSKLEERMNSHVKPDYKSSYQSKPNNASPTANDRNGTSREQSNGGSTANGRE